jgi:hypothetical protein
VPRFACSFDALDKLLADSLITAFVVIFGISSGTVALALAVALVPVISDRST